MSSSSGAALLEEMREGFATQAWVGEVVEDHKSVENDDKRGAVGALEQLM